MRLLNLFTATVGVNLSVPVFSGYEKLWRQDADFISFIRKYNKQYKDDAEYELRHYLFNKTRGSIAHAMKNHADSHFVADVNEFADMSSEEFTSSMLCGPSSNRDNLDFKSRLGSTYTQQLSTTPPESVDWEAAGAMGPVRDQGKCGACYAIQAAILAESHFKIATRISQVVPLSAQQIIDCSTGEGNSGCEGGTVTNAFVYARLQGLVKEKAYPYISKYEKCKTDVVKSKSSQCITSDDIIGWLGVPPLNELAMRTAVAEGPIAVAIHSASPGFRNYKSGVITTRICGEGNLNHMVTIVGYGSTPAGVQYWKIVNSWGTSWGDKGYAYIQRNDPTNPAGPCSIMRDPDLYPVFKDGLTADACLRE